MLADLSGVGVVRLDDDARVDFANHTAHVLLDRAPTPMIGHTAIEAFIDRRIEEIAETALHTGFGSGEIHVRDPDGPTYAVRARRSATPASGSSSRTCRSCGGCSGSGRNSSRTSRMSSARRFRA